MDVSRANSGRILQAGAPTVTVLRQSPVMQGSSMAMASSSGSGEEPPLVGRDIDPRRAPVPYQPAQSNASLQVHFAAQPSPSRLTGGNGNQPLTYTASGPAATSSAEAQIVPPGSANSTPHTVFGVGDPGTVMVNVAPQSHIQVTPAAASASSQPVSAPPHTAPPHPMVVVTMSLPVLPTPPGQQPVPLTYSVTITPQAEPTNAVSSQAAAPPLAVRPSGNNWMVPAGAQNRDAGSSWQRVHPGTLVGSPENPFGVTREAETGGVDQEDAELFKVLVAAHDPDGVARAEELYAKGPVKAWYAYFNDFQIPKSEQMLWSPHFRFLWAPSFSMDSTGPTVQEHVSTFTSMSADELRWLAYQTYGSAEAIAEEAEAARSRRLVHRFLTTDILRAEPWLTDPKFRQGPPAPLTRPLGSFIASSANRPPTSGSTRQLARTCNPTSSALSARFFSGYIAALSGTGQQWGRPHGPGDDDNESTDDGANVGNEGPLAVQDGGNNGTHASAIGRGAASHSPLSLVSSADDTAQCHASRTTAEGTPSSPILAVGSASGSSSHRGPTAYQSIAGTDLQWLLPHVHNARERLRHFVRRYDPRRLAEVDEMWARGGKEAWREYFDRFQVPAHERRLWSRGTVKSASKNKETGSQPSQVQQPERHVRRRPEEDTSEVPGKKRKGEEMDAL